MTFVIPMAGKGSRFLQYGYKKPKYMIKVNGKSLFEYSMNSLPIEIANKIIFICLREHELKFGVSDFIKRKIQHFNIEIIFLDSVTRGQAETVYRIKDKVEMNEDMLIYNIDTYFSSSRLKNNLLDKNTKYDGIIGAFIDKSDDEKWSFAEIDENGIVKRTTEKEKISNYALTGLYHFTKAIDFFEIAEKWIKNDIRVKDEFYIAPMYNDLILNGKNFKLDIADKFIPLGTPMEVKKFEAK